MNGTLTTMGRWGRGGRERERKGGKGRQEEWEGGGRKGGMMYLKVLLPSYL